MFIAITTISIVAITSLVWAGNRILPLKICPICAGVAGTWLWMLTATFLGYEIDMIVPAMLMGGSVVGIAYQLEKYLPENRSPFLWKTVFIPLGFSATYSLISQSFMVFLTIIILFAALALWFAKKPRRNEDQKNKKIEELKNKMEDCC